MSQETQTFTQTQVKRKIVKTREVKRVELQQQIQQCLFAYSKKNILMPFFEPLES